jgi:cold shock CspA family protein/ribosome-associated translation inhibitor RaiA
MKVPMVVSFRDIPRDENIEKLIRHKVAKLERVCDYLSSCRITIEKSQKRHKTGNPYHVRIDLTVPPSKELAVSHDPGDLETHNDLRVTIRRAFEAAERQLKELVERQRRDVKRHPEQVMEGLVVKLSREEGFGFLKTLDGRDVYFHRNSVLGDQFERLEVGTGVNFDEEEGEHGPQATTVRIVDKPGSRAPKIEEHALEPPLGWTEKG